MTPNTMAPQWQRQIAILRELAHKAEVHADLVDAVDPRWRARIQVHNGGSEIRFLPLGDTLNQGRLLRVRVKARWSLELTDKPVHGRMGTVIKRRVVPFEEGGVALNEFLGAMLEGGGSEPVGQDTRRWEDTVASFRQDSDDERTKADLLESVRPKWTKFSEANDNGQRVEIQRLGDTPSDGVKLNIRLDGDRLLFALRHQESTGRDDVLREAAATIADAPPLLDELLTTMLGHRADRSETVSVPAQDAFKAMVRKQVAPALRDLGFKGSGNKYEMTRDEYRIQIQLQRSKWSTRDSVQFDANLSVIHPATMALFDEQNQLARQQGKAMESSGSFHSRLNALAHGNTHGFPWIIRANEPTEPVAHDFIETIRRDFLPVIEEEIHRPLLRPTPLSERTDQTGRSPSDGTL
jgi:hypothetical protein